MTLPRRSLNANVIFDQNVFNTKSRDHVGDLINQFYSITVLTSYHTRS